jgi:23S rRNA (uracil1939-C5)-methyltransferase
VHLVRDFLRERQVPAYDPRRHTGHARFLVVRRSVASGELLVNLVTTSADYALREGLVSLLTTELPELTGIVHSESDRKAQVAVGDRQTVWYGRAGMTERLGRFEFDLGPASFFQTNSLQAARLYDLVVDCAQPAHDDVALDLYCGTGTIGLYLAPYVSGVIGVEASQEAVDCAKTNATRNGIENARFVCADVLAWLKSEGAGSVAPSPLIVLDPPRAGLHPDVPRRMAELRPRRVVYVSCNPAALARDAQLLSDLGLTLKRVAPLDMFPQTAHMECVAVFEP